MRVFVAGGSGMIGSRLVRALHTRGDQVVLLTRRPDAVRQSLGPACTVVAGDPLQPGPWAEAVDDCDAAINLTGENLFNRRWNEAFKNLLRDSRVKSTRNVVEALARKPATAAGAPKVLVNATATGYYGPHGDQELTEESPPGDDFLARLCVEWEATARKVEAHGVRASLVRIGVVLGKEAGPIPMLLTPFRLGVGGPVGSGNQWFSWVHHADIVGLLLLALDNPAAAGPLNGTAPQPVRNGDFTKAFGRALHRPAFLPVPSFALKLRLGEVADIVTTGMRVLPAKALALGYKFKFPDIEGALADVLRM
jgi:uncharacterized protein (TIGR01777 family)